MPKPRETTQTTGQRTSSAREDANAATGEVTPPAAVTVRHYCQGIGDCHLLRFPKPQGGDFWMLIDCGVHSSVSGGSATMAKIVDDISKQTKHLDVVVVTHEHTDHVSGFLTAADIFKQHITVGDVWMAWTENPVDRQARELDKYKQQAVAALQSASHRLDSASTLSPHLTALHTQLDALLGFSFGAKGERVRAARDAAVARATGRVCYLEPSDPPISIPGLPNLRVYVLGPPRDAKLLGLTERASEMYGFRAGWPLERALSGALAASVTAADSPDDGAPFEPNVGTALSAIYSAQDVAPEIGAFARDHYFGPDPDGARAIPSRRRSSAPDPAERDQSWRRIDLDWLGVSADLALQLDDKTNNTSLVLAFELVDTGRVLLFAADAQVGNWLSWQNARWDVDGAAVTGPDLLARTVYYKVGHHGSENATLKQNGLELMTSSDLAAFIPTNEQDAKKVGWGQMPNGKILAALAERCSGRVVRADDPWVADAAPGPAFRTPSGSVKAISHQKGIWVELDLA